MIDFFKDDRMDFELGAELKYNNSGYVILGYIIELVSGQSYADFVQEHIFQKFGMNAARNGSHFQVIPNQAYGYHQKDDYVNRNYVSLSLPDSSGSQMSSVNDLLIRNEAQKSDRLLKPGTKTRLYRDYSLDDGETIKYGYGWHIVKIGDITSHGHGGSIFGFKSMGVYLPKRDINVVGLTNCDCNSPTVLTRQIAAFAMQY
ncbi:hypothetical protein GCM10009119_05090 [Algoriphagus jejuensis]|uniref:Beta-lactamase-related domain-containing protein n=1 Tax=Algoriphagus jejuensis TaxID=419934 RepID=A0ABN1MVV0_9BACT